MTIRILLSLALGLFLGGGRIAAQAPGDPDYEPDPDVVDEYESLGEEAGSDYELDDGAFNEAADQAVANAPQVVPPTGGEIGEFRAGLEAHWGGNLPALWAYLDSIDPAGGDNPEPPRRRGRGPLGGRTTTTTNSAFLIESARKSASVARAGGTEAAAALPELLAPAPGWTPGVARDTLAD